MGMWRYWTWVGGECSMPRQGNNLPGKPANRNLNV